jgi:NAD(P)H dehydrogenase (quinone)
MNYAMFQTAVTHLTALGHQVKYSDLYDMAFEPVSDRGNFTSLLNPDYFKQQLEEAHASKVNGFAFDINSEQEKVEWCDLMIWQFPLWWFSVPAILKGWVDRVFAMGRFYESSHLYENGIFKGKRAVLSLTTGGVPASYQKGGFNGDMDGILRPIHRGILSFVGFSVLSPQIVYGPARISAEERVDALRDWEKRLAGIFAEGAMEVGDY